jgi:ribose transport system permease protein
MGNTVIERKLSFGPKPAVLSEEHKERPAPRTLNLKVLHSREAVTLAALLTACLLFYFINPRFFNLPNIAVMLRASAYTGCVAVGIGFLLMSGQIDISVGAIAGLASIVSSSLMFKLHFPVWLGYAGGLAAGAAAGWISSRVVLKMKVPAFLATIAAMYVFRGMALFISNGYTIYPLPEMVKRIGSDTPLGVSWGFWVFLFIVIIGEYILRTTVWGLKVKATGSDREIAQWTEVDVDNVNTSTFMLCGVLSALAGLLLMSRLNAGDPTIGTGWELSAITAAAIGGVSLFGYDGSIIGVALGVLLIQVIQNGLVVIGASAYLQGVEVGMILATIAIYDVRMRLKLKL